MRAAHFWWSPLAVSKRGARYIRRDIPLGIPTPGTPTPLGIPNPPPGISNPQIPTPERDLVPDIPTIWKESGTRDTYPLHPQGTWYQRYLIPPEQTHTCENITFSQLPWRTITGGLREIWWWFFHAYCENMDNTRFKFIQVKSRSKLTVTDT